VNRIKYFELLKDEKHQNNKLNFNGEIFAYGGAGNIKNNILLRFVKERFKRFVVTVDRDKFSETKKTFESLGLKEGKEFIVIGKNETGKKCIEGLVPAEILSQVYAENVELVQQSQENSNEGKDARSKIKTKILEKFEQENEKNNLDIFKDFYPIVKKLNKTFK
jgi:putative ATP-dependent endonuclease of OLD family